MGVVINIIVLMSRLFCWGWESRWGRVGSRREGHLVGCGEFGLQDSSVEVAFWWKWALDMDT